MLFDVNVDNLDDVLDIRSNVIEQLKAGGTVLVEWTSENTTVRKLIGIPLKTLLNETLIYLKLKDPDTYGQIRTRSGVNFYYPYA